MSVSNESALNVFTNTYTRSGYWPILASILLDAAVTTIDSCVGRMYASIMLINNNPERAVLL